MFRKLSIFAIFSFCLSTLIVSDAAAQNLQGCGKQGGTQIYYFRNGFGSGLNFLIPRYDAPFSTLTTNTAICPRFTTVSIATPTTACCIGATDCTNNLVYNFTNIPCPIDTNSGILLVVMAGVGGLVVRKQMA
ncbi:hypothetical protein [Pedobacter agri]|uniref:hypothetical protein n=1 Tax=Pedobacter agri TaxID=454586 RepID=UPI00277D2E92|nr:hypothetical protein [Pedobacter agri]MDQ1139436.1 hypothetical protein [Pedobacter agri]